MSLLFSDTSSLEQNAFFAVLFVLRHGLWLLPFWGKETIPPFRTEIATAAESRGVRLNMIVADTNIIDTHSTALGLI
jgi:hypothetical protein